MFPVGECGVDGTDGDQLRKAFAFVSQSLIDGCNVTMQNSFIAACPGLFNAECEKFLNHCLRAIERKPTKGPLKQADICINDFDAGGLVLSRSGYFFTECGGEADCGSRCQKVAPIEFTVRADQLRISLTTRG